MIENNEVERPKESEWGAIIASKRSARKDTHLAGKTCILRQKLANEGAKFAVVPPLLLIEIKKLRL